MSAASPNPVPREIFSPEIFEELREIRGTAQMRLALEEFSTCLPASFADMTANDIDRDRVFRSAHFLVARAGLMGFGALRDTCVELQHACATGAPFGNELARTRDAAMVTRDAITSLLQRSL
jgi:HPt (histidine-containing phosphotransfer) domain-containing protein